MKLFTQYEYAKLLQNGKQRNHDKDHYPVVKLVMPNGDKWLITEIYDLNHAYGLSDYNGFPGFDYILLQKLVEIPGIKRDVNFVAKYPISVYNTAAWFNERIVEEESILELYVF